MAPFTPLVEKTSCDFGFYVLSLSQEGRPNQQLVGGDGHGVHNAK